MAIDARTNFAYGTVLTAPSPATSGTTMTLSSGAGALMPAVPFNLTIWPTGANPLASTAEIVRVTTLVGDAITVMVRAQEGTSARTIIVGDQVAQTITKKIIDDIETDIAAAAAVTIGTTTITSGTTTRVLYNNAGVVGEYTVTGSGTQAVLSTAPTLTGPVTLTGAVGSSALTITGGTQTASFPALDLSQTWNNGAVAFTGIKFNVTNTASATASMLVDLQQNGVQVAAVSYHGQILGSRIYAGGSLNGPTVALFNNNVCMPTAGEIRWADGTSAFNTTELVLLKEANNVLAQRRTTNAQTFRLYGTYTDSSNYERLAAITAAGDYSLTPQAGGTGTLRGLQLVASGGRVGFFGTTAIAKITTGVAGAAFVAGAGTAVNDASTFGGYTIKQIAQALQNYGLLT
jgi:hypothetical protein